MATVVTREDEVRRHMERRPDHEVVVDEDDQWQCLTCESDELREFMLNGMAETKRRPGRPATGHDPTRSVRIGPVWEDAMAISRYRGETLHKVITRALENYVRRHRRELPR